MNKWPLAGMRYRRAGTRGPAGMRRIGSGAGRGRGRTVRGVELGAVAGGWVDDRFGLGEGLHGEPSANPATAAYRAGPPAERQVRLPQIGGVVDVHPAGPGLFGEGQPALQVV